VVHTPGIIKKNKKINHNKTLHKTVLVAGIIAPIMTLPQIIKIWYYKDATGVSVISWGSYFVMAGFWLAYGIKHKDRPIIVSYILWMLMHIMVVSGTITYGQGF
jgi:uncharacterized protein with PQ loop repeat